MNNIREIKDALSIMRAALNVWTLDDNISPDKLATIVTLRECCNIIGKYINKQGDAPEIIQPDNVQFVTQSVTHVGGYGGVNSIESAARTCTDTGDKKGTEGFVESLVRRGHMSPVEFGFADFLVTVDRGIQQELTRHRHLSFNIESTRWIGYDKRKFSYIVDPVEGCDVPDEAVERLKQLCYESAKCYEDLIAMGAPRDYARKALLLCTASKVRVAGNLRTWYEMLGKRIGKNVHPEFRNLANTIKEILASHVPQLFEQ